MQGGTWINDIGHQSTYNGNVLYGWSESGWNTAPGGASQDTKWSTVIDGLECYTTNVVGNAKVKFNSQQNSLFTKLYTMLTDQQWSKLKIILRNFGIYFKPNSKIFIEAIL